MLASVKVAFAEICAQCKKHMSLCAKTTSGNESARASASRPDSRFIHRVLDAHVSIYQGHPCVVAPTVRR